MGIMPTDYNFPMVPDNQIAMQTWVINLRNISAPYAMNKRSKPIRSCVSTFEWITQSLAQFPGTSAERQRIFLSAQCKIGLT